MDDLVTRLKCGATTSPDVGSHFRKYQALCNEAAERIAELERALKAAASTMRVAVGAIQTGQIVDKDTEASLMRGWKAARAALASAQSSTTGASDE